MFENTHPIVAIGKAFGDGVGHGPLADYVRWEFRPGERTATLAALRRTATLASDRRRGRSWIRRVLVRARGKAGPSGSGLARRPHGVRRPLRRAGSWPVLP